MKYLLSTCLGILLFLIPSASKSQGFRLPTPVHDAGTSNNELHEMVVYDREGNSHLLSEISFLYKNLNKKTRVLLLLVMPVSLGCISMMLSLIQGLMML